MKNLLRVIIRSLGIVTLCVAFLEIDAAPKNYERITDEDGSLFAYRFKSSLNQILLMRIIGGEEDLFSSEGPLDPFAPSGKAELESPIAKFFKAYGIEINDDLDIAFDGEFIIVSNISDEEAQSISLILKVLSDGSAAQHKLDAMKNKAEPGGTGQSH